MTRLNHDGTRAEADIEPVACEVAKVISDNVATINHDSET